MFDKNNPFNEAPNDGMLPDGCGIFERYKDRGAIIDYCGLSVDPNDFDSPLTLFKKMYEKVNRIINAVDLKCNGDYNPSEDIYKLIHNAQSVKEAIEMLDIWLEMAQDEKFDKNNLKINYEYGTVCLVDKHGDKFSCINIPEEQFLDKDNTGFVSAATIEDAKIDTNIVLGDPYLKLGFKVIDEKGKDSISYSYIPLKHLFNIYDVTDTDTIDLSMVSDDKNKKIINANVKINNIPTCAIKIDSLGLYVEDLRPYIEDEVTRATNEESALNDKITKENERASKMEYAIIDLINKEIERAVNKEAQLQTLIQNEADRAGNTEAQLNSKIQNEKERAILAEMDLNDKLNEEIQRSTNKDVLITNNLNDEIQRAIDAETKIQSNLDKEEDRAIKAEKVLDDKINDLSEKEEQDIKDVKNLIKKEEERAIDAETKLDNKLDAEINRSTTKDNELDSKINAEIERSTNKDNELETTLNTEINRAKTKETEIETKLDNEITRSTKKDVELENNLNTEINRAKTKETEIETELKDEIARSTKKDTELETALNAEVKRAKDKETEIETNLDKEIDRSTKKDTELENLIKTKVASVQGVSGVTASTDTNKNVTVSGKVKSGDKILSNSNDGFSTTLNMSISGKTISLKGVNNTEISKVTVPGDDLTFKGSNGVKVTNTSGTVTTSIVLDPDTNNQITNSTKGLLVLPPEDAITTLIDTTGGTKVLTTKANIVITEAGSQVNYIGISNSKHTVVTFYNNSSLEVLFSFNNASAGNNKFIKDYLITSLALPSRGAVEFTKRTNGWHISKLFGYSYFPDLADLSRSDDYALIVKKDGTATIEEIVDMKEWDESILTDLTAVQLEARFPDVPVGFQFVCYSNSCIYEKANMLGGWLKINCQKL